MMKIIVCRLKNKRNVVKDAQQNSNFRGSITVRLISCLFCLHSWAALLMLNKQQFTCVVKSN